MSQQDAEAYLIKNNRNGYPADANDIKAQYGEESYEMRANGMRPPAYGKWLEEQVGRKVSRQTAEEVRKKLLDTPKGKTVEAGYLMAKNLLDEARANTERLRVDLETKFKEKTGEDMQQFIQRNRRAGVSLDAIDTIIKSEHPKEHAALTQAGEKESSRYKQYEVKERARNDFFNKPSAGRVARSEAGASLSQEAKSQAFSVSVAYDNLRNYPIFTREWDKAKARLESELSSFREKAGVNQGDALEIARNIVRNEMTK